jgi:EAL domain-containing protein (putative c-di-GMP-specific phosphodiesterase class I)
MYQAKDDGRNRVRLHDQKPDDLRSTHKRVHWARELREILDDNRVVLYSQPVIRLADQAIIHHEILMRVVDRSGGIVPPGEFLEVAESLGMAQELDLRVVSKVIEVLKGYRGQKTRYFVNLSRTSISDPHWVRRFHNMLAAAPIDHSQLVFEITETAAIASFAKATHFIRELKRLGCGFALDDFGSGFSSFGYLKHLPVDYLKIDGVFVRDIAGDPVDRAMVEAINKVGQIMGIATIAESVETDETLTILQAIGVDYAQGFRISRPKPFILRPGAAHRHAAEIGAA